MSNDQIAMARRMAQDGLDKDLRIAREEVDASKSKVSDAKEKERKARATAAELEATAKAAQEDYTKAWIKGDKKRVADSAADAAARAAAAVTVAAKAVSEAESEVGRWGEILKGRIQKHKEGVTQDMINSYMRILGFPTATRSGSAERKAASVEKKRAASVERKRAASVERRERAAASAAERERAAASAAAERERAASAEKRERAASAEKRERAASAEKRERAASAEKRERAAASAAEKRERAASAEKRERAASAEKRERAASAEKRKAKDQAANEKTKTIKSTIKEIYQGLKESYETFQSKPSLLNREDVMAREKESTEVFQSIRLDFHRSANTFYIAALTEIGATDPSIEDINKDKLQEAAAVHHRAGSFRDGLDAYTESYKKQYLDAVESYATAQVNKDMLAQAGEIASKVLKIKQNIRRAFAEISSFAESSIEADTQTLKQEDIDELISLKNKYEAETEKFAALKEAIDLQRATNIITYTQHLTKEVTDVIANIIEFCQTRYDKAAKAAANAAKAVVKVAANAAKAAKKAQARGAWTAAAADPAAVAFAEKEFKGSNNFRAWGANEEQRTRVANAAKRKRRLSVDLGKRRANFFTRKIRGFFIDTPWRQGGMFCQEMLVGSQELFKCLAQSGEPNFIIADIGGDDPQHRLPRETGGEGIKITSLTSEREGYICTGINMNYPSTMYSADEKAHAVAYVKIGNDWYLADNNRGGLVLSEGGEPTTSTKLKFRDSFAHSHTVREYYPFHASVFYAPIELVTKSRANREKRNYTGLPIFGQTTQSCALDSQINVLFFADGFYEYFYMTLYKSLEPIFNPMFIISPSYPQANFSMDPLAQAAAQGQGVARMNAAISIQLDAEIEKLKQTLFGNICSDKTKVYLVTACLRLFRIENTDESELAEVNWSANM